MINNQSVEILGVRLVPGHRHTAVMTRMLSWSNLVVENDPMLSYRIAARDAIGYWVISTIDVHVAGSVYGAVVVHHQQSWITIATLASVVHLTQGVGSAARLARATNYCAALDCWLRLIALVHQRIAVLIECRVVFRAVGKLERYRLTTYALDRSSCFHPLHGFITAGMVMTVRLPLSPPCGLLIEFGCWVLFATGT